MDISVSGDGLLRWNGESRSCVLGRSGIQSAKREGDGATPTGSFLLRRVFYRPDRLEAPITALPLTAIDPSMGWCDDPSHGDYNRPVTLPHPASCETLWRDDHVYDVVVVLGHNDDPPVPGLGSAIFLHLTRETRQPTEGCVALDQADLLDLLRHCQPGDTLTVQG
ncbi:Protein conserved in bacteria [Candidatus Terasakiella magnetica]|nr:Protein conserved in bacteria [Candidatus Terasakiella magnetica]